MLSVDEALKLVLDHAEPWSSRQVPVDHLNRGVLGCNLVENVVSDIDSPPYDKSIVDGYAVIATDIAAPGTELLVLEEVTAGNVPTRVVEPGTATRIMTGAPIPSGADAVVMVEQTELLADRVRILPTPVKSGQNIMRRATSLAKGETILKAGRRIRAIEIGLLAEVGRESVAVVPIPRVAILPTGNELVPLSQTPGPGQIRNSNGPLLAALATSAGASAVDFPIISDDSLELRSGIGSVLGNEIVVLTGGVSAGVLDLVPQVLAELGVEQVFHKVNLKPGKPLWFGVKRHSEQGRQTLVFGLPGNPVSSLVCFELFVRPAIQKLSGREPVGLPRLTAQLAQDHQQRGDRPTYWPARLERGLAVGGSVAVGREANYGHDDHLAVVVSAAQSHPTFGQPSVTPLPWKGSGDLRTLTDANSLAHFPAGDRTFQASEEVEVLVFPEP
jgi:molybdopterin molybdotransferase